MKNNQIKSKKGFVQLLLIAVIIALIVGGIVLAAKFINEGSLLSFIPGSTTVNVNAGQAQPIIITDDDDVSAEPEPSINLGEYFDHNFPLYIDNRSTNCMLFGGTWISEPDRMGCYNVPVWDDTLCGSAELWTLKSVCINLGGYFTCNSHEVSCELP